MRRENFQALSGRYIPDPNSFVEGAGRNHVGLWIEVDAEDVVSVPLQRLDQWTTLHVPQLYGFVIRSWGDEPRVCGEGHVGDPGLVAGEDLCGLGDGISLEVDGVSADRLVPGGRGEEAAIRGEFKGG